MDKKYLQKIAPVIKDKIAWDAFLAILEGEEQGIIRKLRGTRTADELIRINAQYDLIQKMKDLRELVISIEKDLAN